MLNADIRKIRSDLVTLEFERKKADNEARFRIDARIDEVMKPLEGLSLKEQVRLLL